MKKSTLNQEEKEVPKKDPWSTFRDLNREQIKEILEKHGRVIVFTSLGDIYELKELEF